MLMQQVCNQLLWNCCRHPASRRHRHCALAARRRAWTTCCEARVDVLQELLATMRLASTS